MAGSIRWAGTGVFMATEARVQMHEWLAIVTSSMVQGILVLFVAVLRPSLLPVSLVGAMVYSAFLGGQRVLNEAAYIRIDHRLNELYHASPLSPEAYFLGMASGILVAYLPPMLVFLAIVEVIRPLPPLALGVLVLVILAVWILSSSIGYTVSTLFKDMKAIWPYSSLLVNTLGILPPVFYPLALVAPGLRWVALVVPTSAAAVIVNAAAGNEGVAPGEFALAAAALALEALVMFAFGTYWARRAAQEA